MAQKVSKTSEPVEKLRATSTGDAADNNADRLHAQVVAELPERAAGFRLYDVLPEFFNRLVPF